MNSVDFKFINDIAMQNIFSIFSRWLPNGKKEGNEYVALNPTRQDKRFGSFKVSCTLGVWSDFAEAGAEGEINSA